MNEETVQRRGDNEPLDLGTESTIHLWDLAHYRTAYSIEQLIAALETTTTLTDLVVDFEDYKPTPENNRRIIKPLCRCLSNLRSRNEHHPLRDLTLRNADFRIHGLSDVFEQFLIAATKYGGIWHVKLHHVYYLPIQCLVEFCRNSNNLNVLELTTVVFSDGRAALSVPPNRPQGSSIHLVLDTLSLPDVSFINSASATAFADFMARMTVRTFVLGGVRANAAAAAAAAAAPPPPDRDDDLQMTNRILSEIKISSVKQLELRQTCRIEHFNASLEAGTTSLTELVVHIEDDYMERLELLTSFIRRAVQLNSLTIHADLWQDQPITLPRDLLRAIEACSTVTRFRVFEIDDFSREEVQQLQRITARNEELSGFVASPGTYPTDKLCGLMRRFDNCPTGRYMLARNLPVVLSFEKIKGMYSSTTPSTMEPNPKKRKIP